MVRKLLSLMLVCAVIGLAACPPDTRTIKVTCGPTKNETISADFGSPNVAGISVGLLNTHQLPPGALFQLNPPQTGDVLGSGSIPKILKTTDADFAPLQPEATISKVVKADFSVEVDADVTKAAASLNIDLKTEITNNTDLTVTNAQRKTLMDPLALLNGDNGVADLMKTAPTSRFVLVSAVSYGDGVSLSYANNSSSNNSANILKVGKFTVDVKYDCSDVASINASAKNGSKAALLFFYVPVVLNATTGKVEVDQRPIDLTKYSLGAAFL
jgi:hypothetical protein